MQKALALLAAVLLTGCHTLFDATGGNAQIRFYAAVADYNSAKALAAVYVELPSTSSEIADHVLSVVEKADHMIHEAYRLLAARKASADVLDRTAQYLLNAQALLNAITMGTEVRYPVKPLFPHQRVITLREWKDHEHKRRTSLYSARLRARDQDRFTDSFRTGEIRAPF